MDTTDVAIIGAGPCGLFQAFELGLQGIDSTLFDSLEQPGGQCIRLYPDKPVYDIPGCPEVSARQLVENLLRQLEPFSPRFSLGQTVKTLNRQPDGSFLLETATGDGCIARAVVIASGAGAFEPVPLLVPGAEKHRGGRLRYSVEEPAYYRDRHLVIVGGGDAALDWTLALLPVAASVTLVHRSERMRAQPHLVAQMRQACADMKMQFLIGRIAGILEREGAFCGVKVQAADGVTRRLDADDLLVMFGLSPQGGMLRSWGLELHQNQVRVDTERFETSAPGIFAVGDINWYPGKRKLILSGFHEAALAAYAIRARLRPDQPDNMEYTTTSPAMHKRLNVSPDISDLME